MINLLDVLRRLGGEAHRKEVFASMINDSIARAEDLDAIQTDGGTRFRKHVDFSRKELFDSGLIGDGGPGIWYLTSTGENTFLTHATANRIVALNQKLRHLREPQRKELAVTVMVRRRPSAGPTTGPIPVTWSGCVIRDVLRPAVTYVLQWGNSDVWKVGQTNDIERRVSQINKHVPVEILGTYWNLLTTQQWDNCVLAHAMEQEVFRLLHTSRVLGERLRCSEETLRQAWTEAACQVENVI
jgi:hypothetical protein